MRLRRISWLPSMLFLILDVVYSSLASPRPLYPSLFSSAAQGWPESVTSASTKGSRNHVILRRHATFSPRSVHHLSNGWIGRVDKMASFLPGQVAASYLESFYTGVIDKVLHTWVNESPVTHFSISMDNISLDFISETRTIPWNFVLAFAQQMISQTRNGFIGKYGELYSHFNPTLFGTTI